MFTALSLFSLSTPNHSIRCFYIDSHANARANGMQIKPNLKNEDVITKE